MLFTDVTPGNYLLGGKPLKDDNIFVQGQVRAGRGPEIKAPLILDLMGETAEIARTHESHMQVYIVDVPARQIAEWGQLLPLPGEEAAWDAAVPQDVKRRMTEVMR